MVITGSACRSNINYQASSNFFGEQPIVGWNLGNSLDVYNDSLRSAGIETVETFWGNPVTSKALISEIRKAGFSAIRIPATWYMHMDKNYNIDPAWLNRIQKIVDYCIENNFFVIINAHHENWYDPSDDNIQKALVIMEKVWKQIGQYFKNYDNRLLFEGMNEPRLQGDENEWGAGTKNARVNVNWLNQKFVNTIRELGGNNATRLLLVTTYCASNTETAISDLDTSFFDKYILVSIHMYQPMSFTSADTSISTWDPDNIDDTKELIWSFKILNKYFVRKGIPVAITEFGTADKNNELTRSIWVHYIKKNASALGIPLFWWDNGKEYAIIDRFTLKWLFPRIVSELTRSD